MVQNRELAIVHSEFDARQQIFRDVLAPYRIPPAAFKSGMVALFEQQAWILGACDPQSVMNSIMSFAVLGLRLDLASQQGCIVPFKRRAQPITMVKGYTVLAARAGYTLQGRLVREGDKVKEYGGAEPRIEHEPLLGNKGKIIGAYAVARSKALPVLFSQFLTIDDLIATRDRSKGYRAAMADGKSHPWATDFEAMCIKTPKRLLSKDIPNDMLGAASWLETQHDLGRAAYLRPDGQGVIEGEVAEIYPERQPAIEAPVNATSRPRWILQDGSERIFPSIERLIGAVLPMIEKAEDLDRLLAARERNSPVMAELAASGYGDEMLTLSAAFDARLGVAA